MWRADAGEHHRPEEHRASVVGPAGLWSVLLMPADKPQPYPEINPPEPQLCLHLKLNPLRPFLQEVK